MFKSKKASIFAATICTGLMAFASVGSASPALKRVPEYRLGDNNRLVEQNTATARAAQASTVISAILDILPRSNTADRVATPAAVSFARSGVSDSHLIERLREAGRPDGKRDQARPATALFQSVGIPFGKLPAMERMSPVEKDIDGGFLGNCASQTCERSAKILSAIINEEPKAGFTRLLSSVNSSVNRLVRYQPDRAGYRQLDFWANPSTTLNRGAGDCEDYAILKLAVLAEAGVPRSAMSIVVLRDQRRGVYHAVLSIRTTQGNFILDNVREEVLPDVELPDYVPLYSVSRDRGYIYGRPVGGSRLVASMEGLDGIAPGEGQNFAPMDFEEMSRVAGPR
jgi:predicted transglutaminase-like cysteine proteinase